MTPPVWSPSTDPTVAKKRARLLALLEEATGPSSALDTMIREALLIPDGTARMMCGPGRFGDFAMFIHPSGIRANALDYTRFIDAATTLVPAGFEWLRTTPLTMSVYRVPAGDKEWAVHIDGAHPVPAMALCIAAIKAIDA